MNMQRAIWLGIALVAMAMCFGCARAYHSYPPCSCVPYSYCPQPPLPYTTYESCHCPTPIAAKFNTVQASSSVDLHYDN